MIHKHRRILIIGAIVVVAGLVGIQFAPSGYERSNPPVLAEPAWDTAETRALAQRACFDCHSNETVWPGYSNVAPLSWMVERDVVVGREVLNFSEWASQSPPNTEAVVETVTKGEMPLPYYVLLHPQSRLSSLEQGELVNGLIATLEGSDTSGLDADQRSDEDTAGDTNGEADE